MVKEVVISTLRKYKNTNIELSTLERCVENQCTYKEFYSCVINLVESGILTPIKAAKTNGKSDFLYNKYKIQKADLYSEHRQRITNVSLNLRLDILLDNYYALSSHIFEDDLPYILKINDYLNENGYPEESLYEPELAFRLVGDEKWFEQKKSNGTEVLSRLGLVNSFKKQQKIDPVAFGIDLGKLNQTTYNHLIVENKTAYLYLLEAIQESPFTTVIYGSGNMIPSTIRRFKEQLPIEGNEKFYYFGDLDREGLRIWYSVYEVISVEPAIPFYRALMRKRWVKGKANQKDHLIPRLAFYEYFTEEEAELMGRAMVDTYVPQEALTKIELQRLMKEWVI